MLRRVLAFDWTPGAKYTLTIDSAAVTGIYGDHNKPFKHEFTVKPEEEYSAVHFTIQGLAPGEKAVVQLLGNSDTPLYTAPVGPDGRAMLLHLAPSTYYARLFLDRNANGRWDTGILDSIQPEEVYYFPKPLKLKKNWDVAQDWNINELPLRFPQLHRRQPLRHPGTPRRRQRTHAEQRHPPLTLPHLPQSMAHSAKSPHIVSPTKERRIAPGSRVAASPKVSPGQRPR